MDDQNQAEAHPAGTAALPRNPAPGGGTPTGFEAARRAWLAAKGRHTARAYQLAYRQFFAWAGVRPWQVSPELAQAWVQHMAAAGLAARSINLKLSALVSFYDFAARPRGMGDVAGVGSPRPDGLWPAGQGNPFQAVPRPPVPLNRRSAYPSPGEVRAILAAINIRCRTGRRDYALLLALLVTGRRPGEVLGLRWGDLEPLEGGDYAWGYRNQAGRPGRAMLSHAGYRAICAYLETDGRPPGHMRAEDFIFVPLYPERIRRLPGQAGRLLQPDRPLSVSTANRIVKKYARRAGVDPAKAHLRGLRRAAARLRLRAEGTGDQGTYG